MRITGSALSKAMFAELDREDLPMYEKSKLKAQTNARSSALIKIAKEAGVVKRDYVWKGPNRGGTSVIELSDNDVENAIAIGTYVLSLLKMGIENRIPKRSETKKNLSKKRVRVSKEERAKKLFKQLRPRTESEE